MSRAFRFNGKPSACYREFFDGFGFRKVRYLLSKIHCKIHAMQCNLQ